MSTTRQPTISVIMPCLNEEKSIRFCVRQAISALKKLKKRGIMGEVIVVDNGSIDQSPVLAKKAGARVIFEKKRGYGNAYLSGLKKARGTYIIMGDSDRTYDFGSIPFFIKELQKGADLVLGSRFKGNIATNAMNPWHRYVGNPILTFILNVFYGSHISDAHTGLRAFTRSAYKRMMLKSTGMEFASEMIVKAIFHHMNIKEIPISYSIRKGTSKLSPLADAWRHIRFMLLFAPTYAFIFPGVFLCILGLAISLILLPGPLHIGRVAIDINTMMVGILLTNLGIQIIFIGFFARQYAENVLKLHGGVLGKMLLRTLTTKRLMISGVSVFLIGFLALAIISGVWAAGHFQTFPYIRDTIFFVGITIMGTQIIFSSLLFGFLGNE